MRILQLTPGTGSFYCGSCLRDHALVKALRGLGHDVLMVPLYLPHVLDEPPEAAAGRVGHGRPRPCSTPPGEDTAEDGRGTRTGDAVEMGPLFFGGINVYLQQKLALFRKTPAWIDRLLDAPGLLRWAGRRAGLTRPAELGELTLSMLRGEEGRQAKELDKLLQWLRQEGRPDVVLLSNSLLVGLARRIRRETQAKVVCSLQGEDGFLDGLPEPQRTAAWKLLAERTADVDALVAPSRWYAARMAARLGVKVEGVRVVYNGVATAAFGPPEPPDALTIGYLARFCREKGLLTLVEAFVRLAERGRIPGGPGVRLKLAGAQTAGDVALVEEVRARLARCGLAERVEIRPNLPGAEKQAFLRGLSVLSVPATCGEAFGLYVLEALASGVPVVQPRHGAFPELVEATGGGVLCAPDDPAALATALEEVLATPGRAAELGARGRAAVAERFDVVHMARGMLEVCGAGERAEAGV